MGWCFEKDKAVENCSQADGCNQAFVQLCYRVFAVSVAIWIFEPNITRLFDSIWYCFSVATTIGLGDVLATTLVGRVLSIFLSICSILIIAVVPGVITSYYVESTKLRADESSAKFLDDLEHLPELSKEELTKLSEKVKKFNRKK